jgi:hypothetical protein
MKTCLFNDHINDKNISVCSLKVHKDSNIELKPKFGFEMTFNEEHLENDFARYQIKLEKLSLIFQINTDAKPDTRMQAKNCKMYPNTYQLFVS